MTIVQRLKIERTSDNWKKVIKPSWKDIKKLNLDPQFWGFSPTDFLVEQPKEINSNEFEEILKRCGEFLKTVDLSSDSSKTNKYMFLFFVALYCPAIKSITTDVLNINGIVQLTRNCQNIVELIFTNCSFPNNRLFDYEFACLFKKNKHLRILKFLSAPKIDGSCLLDSPFLETLDLVYNGDNFEAQFLAQAIKEMKNLKVFNINLSKSEIKNVILALQHCSNLKELKLEGWFQEEEDINISLGVLFENKKNLEILKLQSTYLTGECFNNLNADVFKELALNYCEDFHCKYLREYFDIFKNLSSFDYTDEDITIDNYNELIKFISLLENLKYLKVSLVIKKSVRINNFLSISSLNLENLELIGPIITNESLENFGKNLHNLKKLRLKYCKRVTDTGLFAITSLQNLEDLSISRLPKITDAGFNKMENLKKLIVLHCDEVTDR